MSQQYSLPKQETGEVYTTGNVLIRWISKRLTRKIGKLLQDIGAAEQFGLDIGCAEGYLLADLKQQGIIGKVVAIELELEKITSSVANGMGVQFVQGDAENIGVRSKSFDYVMATEVLEHLPYPEKALAEICRVAKKNAPIILSVPHEPYFHIGNICRGKHLHRGGRTPSHLHFWHRKDFRSLITPYVRIEKEYTLATFPWLLYLCTCK
ncbi:MAG: class I SAM-dependent methyltransferase [Desulfobulbus oligotrophicus]|jgi:2-polyprenyl-3-methyl-5-hydroxy-6-metoxy-1,4-benzoquinol methylase|nr:class I SAM-dependent methyltransferase [Desulfobulbus oligotrophicus]